MNLLKKVGRVLNRLIIASVATISIGLVVAYANYSATQGSGTTFLSYVVSTVHAPGFVITDSTQVSSATVKAASTAPVATDTALVVAISPNGTNTNGIKAPASSAPVVQAGMQYETVTVSQTAQTLGVTGAAGDYIAGVLVTPVTTSPGNVMLLDNATTISLFIGGSTSVSNLVPFMVPLGMFSVSGAWKLTTGANVTAIGIGNFTP